MAQGDTHITFAGRAVDDPELRFTSSGTAVANFRIASNPRRFNKQTNQWEDGEAVFMTVNAWRTLAENVAASVKKGHRVIATGILQQRSFESRDGQKRTVYELAAEDVGMSMQFDEVERRPSTGSSSSNPGGTNNDPWSGQTAGRASDEAPF